MKNKSWLLLFAAVLATVFAFGPIKAEADKEPLNVSSGTIASNVDVEDVSLSGLTYEDGARALSRHYESLMETMLYARGAEEEQEWSETFAELGLHYDSNDCMKQLKDYVLKGSLLNRYKFAKDLELSPVVLKAEPIFDESYMRETILEAVKEWDCEPEESTATYRDGELEIKPGVTGHIYDFEEALDGLFRSIKETTFSNKGYDLVGSYTTKEPVLTAEKVKDFTVIGTYTTGYSAPMDQIGRNRETNLVRSTENMCGHVFAPGETISALAMYGAVTAKNGYAQAGTYTSGGHTDEIGGGICQTTSTLYNAVLYAELDVIYRKNHSFPVSYLDPSRDAMVYAAGGSDFKFRNSSSDYIIIDSFVDTEKRELTVSIIGHEDHPETHKVEYEYEVLSITPLTHLNLVQRKDASLPLGFVDGTNKIVIGASVFPARKSRLWKITTDDGVTTKTVVSTDTYKELVDPIEVAADTTCTYEMDGLDIIFHWKFIDSEGTGLWENMANKTQEERVAFNQEMTELMEAKGLKWPYTGDEYSVYDPKTKEYKTIIADTYDPDAQDPDPEPESGSESESESETGE